VYFAPLEWLPIGDACFKELRENCEPTVFSLHQLLWNIVHDSRSTANVLKSVVPLLQPAIQDELRLRSSLRNFGVQQWQKIQRSDDPNQRTAGDNRKRRRQSISQDEGEMECDLCRTSLFFSRVEYHPNKSELVTWCLLHALKKVKERSRLSQAIKVFYAHEDEELRQSLNDSQDNIRSKTVRRTVSHQRSSTL
jgi:protein Jumonji